MAQADQKERAMNRGWFVTMAAVVALAGVGNGGDGSDAAKPAAAAKPAVAVQAPVRTPAAKRRDAAAANHWACDTRWMYTDDPSSAWVRKCW
jgi:NAD(P)H-hydrate repair Nnr-like enzyme with NAD(P)H-hydrate epimerase domain